MIPVQPLSLNDGWLHRLTPAGRRRRRAYELVLTEHANLRALWESESQDIEKKRQARRQSEREARDQYHALMTERGHEGVREHLHQRHRALLERLDATVTRLIRNTHMRLAAPDTLGHNQIHRFKDEVPDFLKGIEEREGLRIDWQLTIDGLARSAPDNPRLYSGVWFAEVLSERFALYHEQAAECPIPTALADLAGDAFERYLADQLRQGGATDVSLTRASGDYGADIILKHRGRMVVIQAKRYSEDVGVEAVNQVIAARQYYRANEAFVVTTAGFTRNARHLAERCGVELVAGLELPTFAERILKLGPSSAASTVSVVTLTPPTQADDLQTGYTGDRISLVQSATAAAHSILSAMRAAVAQRAIFVPKAVWAGALAGSLVLIAVLAVPFFFKSSGGDPRAAVQAVLEQWQVTTRQGQVEANMNCYAPFLDRYFRLTNVTRERVASDKWRAARLYPNVHLYRVGKVEYERETADEVTVGFDKEWNISGKNRFSGAVRQRLTLKRLGGEWRITSEEEMKVYWVKRQRK